MTLTCTMKLLVKDCTDEQVNEALDCRWVKVWRNETDLRCRVVVRGCFQNVEKNEEDNLFASTPSLVTMRLLLCMAMSRNGGITPSCMQQCLAKCTFDHQRSSTRMATVSGD